ncbi:MAG: autotransporter-associated beta strand repeat-containing protein, partial [Planctomycetota bacterium]|nr:autotransporter-associated beta strand repeat-containing protein [Planctomycetota bacterium]
MSLPSVALAIAVVVALSSGVPAADLYWSDTGTWDTTATNWGNAPGTYTGSTWSNDPPDSAIFEGIAGTVTLGEAITAAGLTFAVDGYTVTADTLTLSGTPTIDAGTNVSATIASVLAGSDEITKTGSGVLTISNANSHTGGTRLEGGILAAGNNAALGTGTLTLAGGTIRPTATRVIGNAISVATGTTSGLIDGGSGDLMYTGAATGDGNLAANSTTSRSMWLQGDWSGFTGQIEFTVNGGGTNYRLGGAPGSTTFNDGTNGSDFSQATFVLSGTGGDRGLSWSGAQGATVRVGTLSGTGGRIISGANSREANWEVGGLNQTSTAAVVITGNATSLTKVGTGMLTLSGDSTYGGTTTVSAGTLQIGNRNALGSQKTGEPVTQVVVESGATIDFNGVPDASYGYTISGSGSGGAGALVNNGIAIGTGLRQASNIRLAADATIGGTGNWALLAPGYAANSLDLDGHTLTKAGGNRIWLRNTTVTAGSITISAGTLSALAGTTSAADTAVSLADVAGATLLVENGGTLSIGSLSGGGTTGGRVNLTNGSLNVGGLDTDTTFSGVIEGGGRVTKSGTGTLTLAAANTYSGGTIISAGMIKAGSATALGVENAAASAVTIASGATLDINGVSGNTGDFYYGMTIAGSGTEGQGALINTGANGSTSLRQTPNITLSADATIGGSGNILMINGGYAANDLDLADNTLTKTGSNTLFLCNTTVSAGTIDIQEGTLSHFNNAANASAAAITLADATGATLALNNLGLQVGSLAGGGATGGNVTLGSATLTLGGRNEDTSFGGLISGTGAVVKTGTGTQTFAGANTYSGGTTISGGTLLAGV